MSESVTLAALLRPVRSLCALLLLTLLGACGGSVSRVEPFVPARLVVFGDELSAIDPGTSGLAPKGYRYSINAFGTDSSGNAVFDCTLNPIWTQVLASAFGLQFADCPTVSGATTTAEMYAAGGATVAQVEQQVALYRSRGGSFTPTTLVTLQAGMNDILAAYSAVKAGTLSDADALTQVANAGATLATLANAIADGGAGGRVLYLTVHSLNITPFWAQQSSGDQSRAANLNALANAFNRELRKGVENNGYALGLVLDDNVLRTMYTVPTGVGYVMNDITHPACVGVLLPNCTTATLQ
ncbi:MAG: hypothetical protein RJA44_1434, partial [Pseudomonadota bacterium]